MPCRHLGSEPGILVVIHHAQRVLQARAYKTMAQLSLLCSLLDLITLSWVPTSSLYAALPVFRSSCRSLLLPTVFRFCRSVTSSALSKPIAWISKITSLDPCKATLCQHVKLVPDPVSVSYSTCTYTPGLVSSSRSSRVLSRPCLWLRDPRPAVWGSGISPLYRAVPVSRLSVNLETPQCHSVTLAW